MSKVTHLYLLVKKDRPCFKIGFSFQIDIRSKQLRQFGSFDVSKSKKIFMYTKDEVTEFENKLKKTLKRFNINLPVEKRYNGHNEWFSMECYEDFLKLLINHIKIEISDNYSKHFVDFEKEEIESLIKVSSSQQEYNSSFDFALKQYEIKKENNKSKLKALNFLSSLNIIGIDNLTTEERHKFKVLFDSNKKDIPDITFETLDTNFKTFNRVFSSYKTNEEHTCLDINLNKDSTASSHWTSEESIKKILSYLNEKRHNSISKEYNEFVYRPIDYENSKVIFIGDELIDNFVFSVEGIERFLPQNFSNEILERLSRDTEDFLYGSLKNDDNGLYLVQVILMILTCHQNVIDIDSEKNLTTTFKINELMEYIQIYSFFIALESLYRKNILLEYSTPKIENIFDDIDINIKANHDYLIEQGLIG
ncbi:GIY-YIG nuclease family protein [Arcobacter sp. YIC-310]|uniref:GIY-YIG nuclease family protein n=1 Tax=Arcobacter sp. YIC-310 TaxID=3376632 RepID=UPI003C198D88